MPKIKCQHKDKCLSFFAPSFATLVIWAAFNERAPNDVREETELGVVLSVPI